MSIKLSSTFLFLASTLLFMASASSQTASDVKPLSFEASQNNLFPSPQRFEYRLENPLSIQVGDIRIQTEQVQIKFAQENGPLTATLQWPHSLFEHGEITVVDSAGKALARRTFTASDLRVDEPTSENVDRRSSLSTLEWSQLPTEMLNSLRRTAFFRFCLTRQEVDTRVILCSPESYFKKSANDLEVGMRAPYREARVQINGEAVGRQGAVYLNDSTESVRFVAVTETGAFLEINTRSQPVEFLDAILLNDGKRILITAQGAEPVDSKRVKRLDGNRWQTVLPLDRPVLYMRGAGEIPLQQNFQIKGTLPKSSDRVFIEKKTPASVYSSSLLIKGQRSSAQTELKVPAQDSNSLLSFQDNSFLWNVEGLEFGTVNRRSLDVGGQKVKAHLDIYRGYPRSLDGSFLYGTEEEFTFKGDLRWWFQNFLLIPSSWTEMRWGAGVSYQKNIQGSAEYSRLNARLYHRLTSGLQRHEGTWAPFLDYLTVNSESTENSLLGAGVHYSQPALGALATWMNWLEIEARYNFMALDSAKPLEQVLSAEAKAFYSLRQDWSFHYGLGLQQMSGKATSVTEVEALTGLSWKF